jgi:hypothetical protein
MGTKGLLPWPIRSKIILTKYTLISCVLISGFLMNCKKYKNIYSLKEEHLKS